MREILFRGKRLDNGEWVEGQLLYFKSSVNAEEFALIVEGCEWDNSNDWFNIGKRAKVIPETIGQFTGLLDKNGKKIFEGDILKQKWEYYKNQLVVISYDQASFGYATKSDFRRGVSDPIDDSEYGLSIGTCEVVGNIHDNPELLKGDS
jgi:uncharacterized phage protein (TIGR01671 family)